jgi:hypothetical protein
MPRKPKPAAELTTDEVLRRLFPKPVVTEAKKEVAEATRKAEEREKNQAAKKSRKPRKSKDNA